MYIETKTSTLAKTFIFQKIHIRMDIISEINRCKAKLKRKRNKEKRLEADV